MVALQPSIPHLQDEVQAVADQAERRRGEQPPALADSREQRERLGPSAKQFSVAVSVVFRASVVQGGQGGTTAPALDVPRQGNDTDGWYGAE
jgi:hypothetical protein